MRIAYIGLVAAAGLAVVVVSSVVRGADPRNADAEAWFADRYGAEAASAADERGQVQLAEKLMRFVEQEASGKLDDERKRRVLYAAEQAYRLGKDYYPEGYRQAGQALIAMQRLDRPNRLEYTERLAELFNQAWSRNRTKHLGSGIEYAQVKVQIAQQRLADLFDQYTFTESVTKQDVLATITAAKRDYQQAFGVANTVLNAAATYQERVKDEESQAMLTEFIEHHTPLRDHISEGQKRLGDFAADYTKVGNDAFPAEAIDAKAKLAAALKAQGADKPTTPDPSRVPNRPGNRPEVALAEPNPQPKPPPTVDPQPATPEPEPEAEPKVGPKPEAQPAPPPSSTRRTPGKSVWQQATCDKCGEAFVPEFGSQTKTCYWCLKKDNIFSGAGG